MPTRALKSFLRLVRLPLAVTAIADVWAGYWIALPQIRHTGWVELVPVTLLSCLFYWFGMVMNDLFDADKDRLHHPLRPIPCGSVSIEAAGWYAASLAMAIFLVLFFSPSNARLTGMFLGVSILAYSSLLKHNALLGALTLGLCRGLNIHLGMLFADADPVLIPSLILGGYVALIGYASTFEEKHPRVEHWVRRGLRGIILLDAMMVLAYGHPLKAAMILALLIPLSILKHFFPVN